MVLHDRLVVATRSACNDEKQMHLLTAIAEYFSQQGKDVL